ncbi:hyaluronoglucuronidase isoform X2 [Maniola jurtina]|uniref:hyaluronoglucuronidase isoform X2 n=1 Tax=Maniola jurtina TaxID=191418 RepID=UPI001E68B8FC|nr:hyaluronoglucuronidase isoform X2 [Maniola jurtina]
MGGKFKLLTILGAILTHCSVVSADSYNVVVGTDEHVNLVDSRFLSFTIDPKYLFSSSQKYNSKECICMATSLTPAYIRIAGPSTSRMSFRNTTIAIEEAQPRKLTLGHLYSEEDDSSYRTNLAVAHNKWEKFVQWAKSTGFDLVFALNNQDKTAAGMWDPNTALKILTMADNANIGNMFWQLGYECQNQSIEEYLNDLETLRVIIETFPAGKAGGWRVVGGDVTPCLQADSKSDFKDYVTLSNDMMDAILLNGNSSSQELERMSEKDRYKLLKLLSTSDTPLWLTEHSHLTSELERAADWMTSLGYSARNGFSVHYRELKEKELYEPTLSFYMALLFKNLVGERVLNVDIEASQAILFAHCTSLRRKPVPGAVSFYGANMDDEPARFSIKMSKKEQGGDIMQFILGHDRNGNIIVNGRAMYHEGDMRPVVKRVRPYKTLLINLPPKSFGFWVLANTKVQACFDVDSKNTDTPIESISVIDDDDDEEENFIKTKRALNRKIRDVHDSIGYEVSVDGYEEVELGEENKAFKEGIDQLNQDLKETLQRIHLLNTNKTTVKRSARQTSDDEEQTGRKQTKLKKHRHKFRHGFDNEAFKNRLLDKFAKITKDHHPTSRNVKLKRSRGFKRSSRVKSKRNLNDETIKMLPKHDNKRKKMENNETPTKNIEVKKENSEEKVRNRRSVNPEKAKYEDEETSENEIDVEEKESFKLDKILHNLKQLSDLELQEKGENNNNGKQESNDGIVLKTKLTADGAVIDISEKSHTGLLKSTLEEILSLLADFNKNINRFWTAMTILE